MKTVVISGSSRGFGLEMAKEFRRQSWNVMLSGTKEESLLSARNVLMEIHASGGVEYALCDVGNLSEIQFLWEKAVSAFGQVDIWVNNAGISQPAVPAWALSSADIEGLLKVDLQGTIYGSQVAYKGMKRQGFGQIYNVEGMGSTGQIQPNMSLYVAAKTAVTTFTKALAKESAVLDGGTIRVCRLLPSIMLTDFLTQANNGATPIALSDKSKAFYNIMADVPETVARSLVPKMIANTKNDRRFSYLTTGRILAKLIRSLFVKQDFFA